MQRSLSKISSMLVAPSLPTPPFAQSEACPPFLLSPSSFGHERRETSAALLPRRNLDLSAFAFVTYNHRVHERVTMALSDWMALKKKKKKTGILLLKTSGPSCLFHLSFLLQSLSHSVGGTRGQSTLLVVIVWAGGIQQEKNTPGVKWLEHWNH